MDNVVSINHTKENVIEFDLTTEGVETKDICVRFVIETKSMDLMFKAKKAKGDKWEVKIPALSILEKTAYNCRLEINSDGYYFEPMKGTVNVVGTAEVYTSAPKNKTLDSSAPAAAEKKKAEKAESAVKAAEKKEMEKKVKESIRPNPTRPGEKPIEQIARELMESRRKEVAGVKSQSPAIKKADPVHLQETAAPIVPQIPKAAEQPRNEKEDKIRAILESAGIHSKKKPERPRMSFVKLK